MTRNPLECSNASLTSCTCLTPWLVRTSSYVACVPSGSFLDSSDIRACPIGYACPEGLLVTCVPTEYQNETGQTACKPVPTGFYSIAGRAMALCPHGSFCVGDMVTPCPRGSFCSSGVATKCPLGSYQDLAGAGACKVLADGTVGTPSAVGATGVANCMPGFACANGVASACGAVFFQDEASMPSCKPVRPVCFSNTDIPPTPTSDRVCSTAVPISVDQVSHARWTATGSTDLIAAADNVYGCASLPAFTTSLHESTGFRLSLVAPRRQFSITPLENRTVDIFFSMTWCTSHAAHVRFVSSPGTSRTNITVNATFVGADDLGLVSWEGSSVATDASCLELLAQSTEVKDPVTFSRVILELSYDNHAVLETQAVTYIPISPSVILVYSAGPGTEPMLSIEDRRDPVWDDGNCTALSFQVNYTGDHAMVPVRWSIPRATDNFVQAPRIAARITTVRGRTSDLPAVMAGATEEEQLLHIGDSPYVVEYTATDVAGNNEPCRFNITIAYKSNSTFNLASTRIFNENVTTTMTGNYMIRRVIRPLTSSRLLLPSFSTDLSLFTAVRLTVRAGPGESFRVRCGAHISVGKMEVNLGWKATNPANASVAPITPAFATYEFADPKWFPSEEAATFDPSWLVLDATVSPDELTVTGSSREINGSFTFSALHITIAYPSGLVSGGSDGTYVADTAVDSGVQFVLLEQHAPGFELPSVQPIEFLTIVDSEPPKLTPCPENISLPTRPRESYAVIVWDSPTASDNWGAVTLTATNSSGMPWNITAPVTVTYTAVDMAGLTSHCSFSVEVYDDEPPVLTCLDVRVVRESGRSLTWPTPIARDNSNVSEVTCDPESGESGDSFNDGPNTVSCTAEDGAHLVTPCNFTVTVESPAASQASESSSTITAVASCAGALLLVVVLVFIVVSRRRRESVRREIRGILSELNLDEDGGEKRALKELKRSDLVTLDALGQGNFGSVQKALYTQSARQSRGVDILVAVKCCHADSAAEGRRALLEEATIMAQFQHPNVLRLIGIVAEDPLMVVIEFMELGALLGLLQRQPLEEARRLGAALDCAQGLAYLHARGFVHRDVAARNVLVNSAWQCKISDFGLSRDKEESSYYRSKGGALPVRWAAPEALEHNRFSEATDVWSFGIMVYEIWTKGETPYKDWSNQRVWVEVTSGTRLPCPDLCDTVVYEDAILSCWDANAKLRPTFAQLVVRLSTLTGKDPAAPAIRSGGSVSDAQRYAGDHAAYVTVIGKDGSRIAATASLAPPRATGEQETFGFPSTGASDPYVDILAHDHVDMGVVADDYLDVHESMEMKTFKKTSQYYS